jgi:hypothetical protein
MPRRRPAQVRTGQPRRPRPHDATSAIDDLSPRALSEISRLERTRGYLWPGSTAVALRMWRGFVHNPYRRLWVDNNDGGCGIWECCGAPWEARQMLEAVMLNLSRQRAREFRQLIDPLDELY